MRYLVVILVLLLMGSCTKTFFPGEDDALTLEQRPYTGSELRLDGYYYEQFNDRFFGLYCFYRNGVILHLGGGLDSIMLVQLEESIKDGTFHNSAKNHKTLWGVYIVENNSIKFERLYPNTPGPAKAYIREGDILNDTTFRITKVYRVDDGKKTEISEIDELYHFKQFNPKPDSTNSFIK